MRFLTEEEGKEILLHVNQGVLSMVTPEGEAYGVTVNPVYLREEGCLFFHCALKGRKLRCIQAHPQVSFTASEEVELIPARFNTKYRSVILSGTASLVEDEQEKVRLLRLLCKRFAPGQVRVEEVIEKSLSRTAVCKIIINTITAKQNTGG